MKGVGRDVSFHQPGCIRFKIAGLFKSQVSLLCLKGLEGDSESMKTVFVTMSLKKKFR